MNREAPNTMITNKAVAYYRVSTQRQGRSGLGLEAQQYAVTTYGKHHRLDIEREFIEVESRDNNNRPILKEALRYCRRYKAVLVIAKLDRLGGNVAFISALMESKVEFVAVDNPNAKKLFIHIMAAFAEDERERISLRTREALAAAKRRGVKLGRYGAEILSKKNKQQSIDFAIKLRPTIENLRAQGFKTIRQITDELNRQKIPTYRNNGARWHINTVYNLEKKIKSFNNQI